MGAAPSQFSDLGPADPANDARLAAAIPPPAGGLGRVFVKGMVFGTVGLFIAKFSSFLQALILGWLFTSKEYGGYGTALGAAIIGEVLTDGGLRRVLVTRGAEYPRIARTSFYVALAFNVLGCLLIFAAAPWYRHDRPEAILPLIVTGVALVLSTLGTVQKCRQSIDMQFGRIAFMGTVSSLLRNVLTVAFAWLFIHVYRRPDLGPLAYALPLIGVNAWEALYVYRTVGRVPAAPVDLTLARQLIGQGKWVIVAMLGGALIYRGDYLVASWLLTPAVAPAAAAARGTTVDVLGQYVFGFQLTVALFSPLSVGMAAIIQPVMARMRDDPARQANAFLRMVRTSLFLTAPASLAAVLVTPLMIHTLWPHRVEWHACVPVIQLLAATECVRQMHQMCLATIDGRGQWKRSAAMLAIDGLLVVVAAFVGCKVGAGAGVLMTLTIAVAVERTLLAVAQAVYTYRLVGGAAWTILLQVVPPIAIALPIGLLAAIAARQAVGTPATQWRVLAGASVPAVIAYVAVARLLTPARYREAADLVFSRFRRRPHGVPVAA